MACPRLGLWLGQADYSDQIRQSIQAAGYPDLVVESVEFLRSELESGHLDGLVAWADGPGLELLHCAAERERAALAISDGSPAMMAEAIDAIASRVAHVAWPALADELGDRLRARLELMEVRRERDQLRARIEHDQLELQSTHRSLTTATDRLVVAEQLAAVGRVASGIAHEIAGQLALVGYAEAIKSRVEDPELREFADVLVAAQRRLAAMVEEIRDFATARAGARSAVERQPAEVGTLVDEALAIMSYDRDVKSRDIVRDYRDRALVMVEKDRLIQVVINLVSNAALATTDGDEIRIELSRGDEVARLAVVDRGQGMSAEVLSRLGELFFTTRGERGSGLGVGICKRIVEDHGGTLSFESSPGEGTRALVTLPLMDSGGAA